MTISDTDRIAREAARLFATGASVTLGEAIHAAVESLGLGATPRPGLGRVRQHLAGMAMQSLGLEGYETQRRNVLAEAEALMTLLEESFDDARTVLAGRATRGQFDGGATLHLRVYTTQSIGSIARRLVETGYPEPQFETADTRLGRLDRMRLTIDDSDVVLTRCPPSLFARRAENLFSDARITTLDLNGLRRKLG